MGFTCIKFQMNRLKSLCFIKVLRLKIFLGGRAQTRQIRFSVIFSLKIEYFDKPYIPLESSFQDLSNDVISFYYTSKVIELLIKNLFFGGARRHVFRNLAKN